MDSLIIEQRAAVAICVRIQLFYLVKKKLVPLPSLRGGVRYVHAGADELKVKSAVAAKLLTSCCKVAANHFQPVGHHVYVFVGLGTFPHKLKKQKIATNEHFFCVEMVKKFFTLQQLSKS